MNLLKIVSVIGVSTVVNLFSGFLKGKIMAVYFGSSGLGIWSQATNLFMISSIISLFGLNQGLIKQIAARDKDKAPDSFINDTLSKSIVFSLLNCLIILTVVIFSAHRICAFFFNNSLSHITIIFITLFLPFQVLGDVFGVFLLANKEIKRFALANILISIFGLAVFVILSRLLGLQGAYLSVGFYGIITFLSFYFISIPTIKGGVGALFSFRGISEYRAFFKDSLSFGALRLVQVTINPLNLLLIRSLIMKKAGLAENGFFDSLTRISIFYTPFITNILWSYTFGVYCGIKDNLRLGEEINKFIRLSLILFVPVSVAIMLFGNAFVNLLFSKDFSPIIPLFYLWFLIDLLRVTSWPMNIVLIAKDRMRLAVTLEFLWNAAMLLLSYLLIGKYSLKGVLFAYLSVYSLFLFLNYVIMNKSYLFRFNAKTFLVFCVSAALILNSGKPDKSLIDYIVISSLVLIFFAFVLNKRERLSMRDAVKRAFAWSY